MAQIEVMTNFRFGSVLLPSADHSSVALQVGSPACLDLLPSFSEPLPATDQQATAHDARSNSCQHQQCKAPMLLTCLQE